LKSINVLTKAWHLVKEKTYVDNGITVGGMGCEEKKV
jgi:hypothetical protein